MASSMTSTIRTTIYMPHHLEDNGPCSLVHLKKCVLLNILPIRHWYITRLQTGTVAKRAIFHYLDERTPIM